MTVITGHVFKQIFKNDTPKLLNAKKAIFDQVYVPLDVPRVGNILLQNRRKQTEGQTYMIKICHHQAGTGELCQQDCPGNTQKQVSKAEQSSQSS